MQRRSGKTRLRLAVAVVAIALCTPAAAAAYPPRDGGPRLFTWHFQYFAHPLSMQFTVGPRTRRSDLDRCRTAVQRYLTHMEDEIMNWESRPYQNYPDVEPFLEYITDHGEMPDWYLRLRPRQDGLFGFTVTDMNQRPDGSYAVPQNRTRP